MAANIKRQYTFKGQKEGEEVILFLRRHWMTHLTPLFVSLVVFIVPLVTVFILVYQYNLSFIPDQIIWFGIFIWFLIGVFFFIYNWLDWYLDIFLVTSIRIIDIDQHGLFHRTVGEASLDKVQDVIYEIKGIRQTLFNYGSVIIHTGGPTGDIVFEDVHDPQQVQRLLITEVERYSDENSEKIATPEDLLSIMLEHERKRISHDKPTFLPAENDLEIDPVHEESE